MNQTLQEESSSYAFTRILTPSSLTASQTTKKNKMSARKALMKQALIFQNIIDEQIRKVQLEGLNQNSVINRVTALRNFLKANHLTTNDVVGKELRQGFPEALERLTKYLEERDWTQRNISNTRSLVQHWRRAVIEHDAIAAIAAGKATPFMQALKSAMNGHAIKKVAKECGVPSTMLTGWINGKIPRGSNEKYIHRVEGYFGLERDSLVSLSGMKPTGARPTVGPEPSPIEYSQTVSKLTKVQFCLKPNADSPLRKQWEEFLRYKTAAVPPYKRTKRGKWRFSPCPLTPDTPTHWAEFQDGKEVASARIAWHKTSAYLGWLCLPTNSGGMGLPEEDVHTLAWLAVPDYLERFMDWTKERIGKRNRGTMQLLAQIASLVRPETGYLRQRPELQATLPPSYHDIEWGKLCHQQYELAQQLVSSYHSEIEVSRDSFEPIRNVVQLPQPMDAIADMVQRMRADRPIGMPSQEIIWARNMMLIMLLACIPLRRRNIAHLTWRADNTGDLYQRVDKSWWVRIPKTRFKNAHGAAGDNIFDCQVNPAAWVDIERYLLQYRPKLLRSPTDLVFLSRLHPDKTEHKPWGELSSTVHTLTARYLASSPGIGAHAFRHIVATAIIKADGGDIKTAALVLNDRIATVERHYAGLRSNDGIEKMAKLLESQFSRMH